MTSKSNERAAFDLGVAAKKRTVFVTVGSTKFENLIDTVLSAECLKRLSKHGYTRVLLQVGNGVHESEQLVELKNRHDLGDSEPTASVRFFKESVEISAYCYKRNIADDLTSADLVISHAGSGSIMESLEADKKLIVVVNESLMDNHQFELAEKMFALGYLLYTTPSGLEDKIELINNPEFCLNKYVPGNPRIFGKYLDKLMNSI